MLTRYALFPKLEKTNNLLSKREEKIKFEI